LGKLPQRGILDFGLSTYFPCIMRDFAGLALATSLCRYESKGSSVIKASASVDGLLLIFAFISRKDNLSLG
jgi:hypothetical protein